MIPQGGVEEEEVAEARIVRPVFGGDRFPFLSILLLDHHGQGKGVPRRPDGVSGRRMDRLFQLKTGRDDPAVVVPDFQRMVGRKLRGRISLRRKKVKWAGRGGPALPYKNKARLFRCPPDYRRRRSRARRPRPPRRAAEGSGMASTSSMVVPTSKLSKLWVCYSIPSSRQRHSYPETVRTQCHLPCVAD